MAIETGLLKLMWRFAIAVFDHIYQVCMFRIKGMSNYANEIPSHASRLETFICNCIINL